MPAPANDNFANATAIGGVSGSATGSNVGATVESGEPKELAEDPTSSSALNPALTVNPQHTVWWAWTCPATGSYQFETAGTDGTNFTNFASVLQAFTGSAVNALTETPYMMNQSIGIGNGFQFGAMVAFNAVAGTVYYLRVDGRNGTVGSVFLQWATYGFPILRSCNSCIDLQSEICIASMLVTGIPTPAAPLIQYYYEPTSVGNWTALTFGGESSTVWETDPTLLYLIGYESTELTYSFGSPPIAAGLYKIGYCGGALASYLEDPVNEPGTADFYFVTQYYFIGPPGGFSQGSYPLWNPFGEQGGTFELLGPTVFINYISPAAASIAYGCLESPYFISNGEEVTFQMPCYYSGAFPVRYFVESATPPSFKLIFNPLLISMLSPAGCGISNTGANAWSMSISVANSSGIAWPGVSFQLLNTGGISGASAAVSKNLAANATTSGVGAFTFTADFSAGLVTATFQISLSGIAVGTISFPLYPVLSVTQFAQKNVQVCSGQYQTYLALYSLSGMQCSPGYSLQEIITVNDAATGALLTTISAQVCANLATSQIGGGSYQYIGIPMLLTARAVIVTIQAQAKFSSYSTWTNLPPYTVPVSVPAI